MAADPPRQQGESHESALARQRQLLHAVTDLEDCLDRPPETSGEWLGELQRCLPRLVRSLRDHFREEEAGYLHRELPLQFPRFADRLRHLAAEHAGILTSADAACEQCGELQSAEMHQLRELNGRVQLLVATIRRHEAEENEILFSAHWDEVGAGD